MTASPNLGLVHLRSASSQPEVIANEGFDGVDGALSEKLAISVSASPYTLSTANFQDYIFFSLSEAAVSPSIASQVTFNVPAIKRGLFVVINGMSVTAKVQISGQSLTAPVVAAGSSAVLYCDGSNVRSLALTTFDIGDFQTGVPTAGDIMFEYVFTESASFVTNFTGSYCRASVAATLQADMTIEKNGVQVGYARFLAAGTVATFHSSADVQFDSGDVLTVRMPNPADATLASVKISLHGVRT